MKKYKLVVIDDERLTGEYDNVVRGFAEADKRAKELLDEYIKNYPDCHVGCWEEGEGMFYDDYLIYQKDCYGDKYWKMMVVAAPMCSLYSRLLDEDEKYDLDKLMNEKEVHICDLDRGDLKYLRKQVCVGSLNLSDYKNYFEIDENEVYSVCESYEHYLTTDEYGKDLPEDQWIEDTPEEFAYYCFDLM